MASAFFEIGNTFVTIALLFLFLKRSFSLPEKTSAHVRHWILFGCVFNFYSFLWLYTAYPLPWMGEGLLQFFGIVTLHCILTIVAGVSFCVVGLPTMRVVSKKYRATLAPYLFASALTLAEIIRSLLVTLLYQGKGTTVALHFTAGTTGNALSSTPLVEFAYFGGVFSLTFILGLLVYVWAQKESLRRRLYVSVAILVLLAIIHTVIPVARPVEALSLGTIITSFKTVEVGDVTNGYKKQTPTVSHLVASFPTSTSIIVFPEDTRYLSSLTEKEGAQLFHNFPNTLFIDGDVLRTEKGFVNSSLFYYQEKGERKKAFRGKELLLPFNEYIPTFFMHLFSLFIPSSRLEEYRLHHEYTPVHSGKTFLFGSTRIGTLICSEILSYSVISRLHKEAPSIVFFQSYLNVFHNNPLFVMHLRSFSKVAAAQLRTPFVGVVNGAPSYIISPYGKILKETPVGFGTTSSLLTP